MLTRLLRPSPTTNQTIERTYSAAGRSLPLRIVRSTRARRLTMRIEARSGGLRLTVPFGTGEGEIDAFLKRHAGWIESRAARLPDRPEVRPGVRIPLRGVPHLIVHVPERRGTVTLGAADEEPALLVHGDIRHLPRRLADFLKREARRDMTALAERHAARLGRRLKTIRFKDTTSRWGSCTADGTLSFSWRIVMAPPAVIDYLVAHEVAHLKEMNHGPAFWRLCRELCPRSDEARAWLKRNGSALQAIRFEA
jgi:predicted metal-dependent hydrolase